MRGGRSNTVAALLGAIRAGAIDLYAETAMRWLATHLLFTHTSQGDPATIPANRRR